MGGKLEILKSSVLFLCCWCSTLGVLVILVESFDEEKRVGLDGQFTLRLNLIHHQFS